MFRRVVKVRVDPPCRNPRVGLSAGRQPAAVVLDAAPRDRRITVADSVNSADPVGLDNQATRRISSAAASFLEVTTRLLPPTTTGS